MNDFSQYSDGIFKAFCQHPKQKEIIERKNDLINKINAHYNTKPQSVLFIGFNPAILDIVCKDVAITEVSDSVFKWIKTQRPDVYQLDTAKKFDYVIAFDEFLTFAENEQQQLNNIEKICRLANKLAITTVKDYKNQDYKEREYSNPAIIRDENDLTAYCEIHNWSLQDKNSWTTHLYALAGSQATCLGQYQRRSLYFKQLAKFSLDAGAKNFVVHKNIMYKSIIKKNYEHVISICF